MSYREIYSLSLSHSVYATRNAKYKRMSPQDERDFDLMQICAGRYHSRVELTESAGSLKAEVVEHLAAESSTSGLD